MYFVSKMEPLSIDATINKDEWREANDVDLYQRIQLRYRQHFKKIYCVHKEFMLIIFIYIFISGGMLIYCVTNLKLLEEQMKTNNRIRTENHTLAINNLIQKYNELKNMDNFHSMPPHFIATSSYIPYHPQTNVSLLTVTASGWINCYLNSYGDEASLDFDIIFKTFCTSPYLMLACKKKVSKNIDVLAWGRRKHILFHSESEFDFHVAHGTKWIYHNSSYLGFADSSDKVVIGVLDWDKNDAGKYLQVKCDTYTNLASFYGDYGNNSKRLCWPIVHKATNSFIASTNQDTRQSRLFIGKGGTCLGSAWQESDDWERLIFERETI